jgi:hypothetical protein
VTQTVEASGHELPRSATGWGRPALPLPPGGATHVLELIAMLLALELIAGRSELDTLPALGVVL